MSDKLCGECWLENDEIICVMPEEHISNQEPPKSEHIREEQLDLFDD